MWAYDGFRPRFLKELAESNQDIGAALKKGAERVGGNEFIEKVGISNIKPTVWDPAEHKHDVPTLILEGDADPVTVDGQAEHYFEQALTGPRTFIKFAGVGHGFDLPLINIEKPYLIGSILIDPKTVKKGESNLEVSGSIPSVARNIDSGGDGNDRVAAVSGSNLEFQDAIILRENKVSVRVINPSAQEGNTAGIHLNIKHNLFTAKVTLKDSKIPRKGKSWVSGTFKINEENYVVKPPANLEDGLELIEGSVQLVLPDKVSVKIKNTTDHDVEAKPKNWIYMPTRGTKFKGACQGEGLPSRNCLIYAFLEMEHEDFRNQKSEFLELGEIRQYIRTIDHRPQNGRTDSIVK
jgi:hypothetical protein